MALKNDVWTTIKLGFVALTAIFFGAWIWHPEPTVVPPDLIGAWHTTDAMYATRGLVIDESTINFETGEGKVTVGFIDRIKVNQVDNRTLVTIQYSLNGEANSVSFYYEEGKHKTIRFKNQERVLWTKDASS